MGCTTSNTANGGLRPFEVKRINDWLATTESPIVYADTSAFAAAAAAPARPVVPHTPAPIRRPPTAPAGQNPARLRYPSSGRRQHPNAVAPQPPIALDESHSTSSMGTSGVIFFNSASPIRNRT